MDARATERVPRGRRWGIIRWPQRPIQAPPDRPTSAACSTQAGLSKLDTAGLGGRQMANALQRSTSIFQPRPEDAGTGDHVPRHAAVSAWKARSSARSNAASPSCFAGRTMNIHFSCSSSVAGMWDGT